MQSIAAPGYSIVRRNRTNKNLEDEMEFGLGLVTGGVITGLALSHSALIHGWLAKKEAAAKQKAAAARQSFESKL